MLTTALLLTAVSLAQDEPAAPAKKLPVSHYPGGSVGIGLLGEHGLSGVARLDTGPAVLEVAGGVSMMADLLFSSTCTQLVTHMKPQVGADLFLPLAQPTDTLRVGPKLGGGWIQGMGTEARLAGAGDQALSERVFLSYAAGLRFVPGWSPFIEDHMQTHCPSNLMFAVDYEAGPLSALRLFIGASFQYRF